MIHYFIYYTLSIYDGISPFHSKCHILFVTSSFLFLTSEHSSSSLSTLGFQPMAMKKGNSSFNTNLRHKRTIGPLFYNQGSQLYKKACRTKNFVSTSRTFRQHKNAQMYYKYLNNQKGSKISRS